MESTSQLLRDVNAANGEDLTYNEEEINKELVKDALAYKGLGIKLLSIAGGLLATSTFMGFVFLIASSSEGIMVVFGLMAIIGAVFLDSKVNNTILDSACIGAYLTGFLMISHGLGGVKNDNILPIVYIGIALLTIICTKGVMLNFISLMVVNGSLLALISINNVYQLTQFLTGTLAWGYTLVCILEPKLLASGRQVNIRFIPLRNGLLFSFLAMLLYHTMKMVPEQYHDNEWISSVMIICTFLFVLRYLIGFLQITKPLTQVLVYALSLLVLLPAIYAPAICGALLLIAVSFHFGHRTGLIMGCIAFIYFVGQYYYSLHYTLLQKSVMMFVTGVLFLIAWFVFKKQLKRYEQN